MEKIKIILTGESGVGKTCIIKQYVNQRFDSAYITTIGTDKSLKEITIKDKILKLEIWDTAGQEQFRSVNTIFMKNSQIAILVYDITEKDSFEKLNYWYETIKDNNKEKVLYCVVGNKNDRYEERNVEEEEGKKFAKDNNMLFFESSAMDFESIEKIFIGASEKYVEEKEKEKELKAKNEKERKEKEKEKEKEKNINLNDEKNKKNNDNDNKKTGWC